jgi:ribulose-phosphate 3-epimerase
LNSISHADYLHVDVMDGMFVPNIAIGLPLTQAIGRIATIPMDVHLMITHPQNYIEQFSKAGADIISFHVESDCDIDECIAKIEWVNSLKPKHSKNVSQELSIRQNVGLIQNMWMTARNYDSELTTELEENLQKYYPLVK